MARGMKPWWPSESTLSHLERRFPLLFYQLERQFGTKFAGEVLLGVVLPKRRP